MACNCHLVPTSPLRYSKLPHWRIIDAPRCGWKDCLFRIEIHSYYIYKSILIIFTNPFLLYLLLFWLICYEWFCFGIDTHNGWIKLKARYHFKLSAASRASDHGVDLAVYDGVLQPVNEKKRKVWSDFVPHVRNSEDSWDGKSSDFPSNGSGITLFSFFSCYRLFTPESTAKSTPWSDARPCSQIFFN